MTLSHVEFQTVFDLDGFVNVLVIEDPKAFTKYCQELQSSVQGDEGEFCLFSKGEQVKMSKYCAFISDVLSWELESKKVGNKLFGDLKELAETEYGAQWYKLKTDIYQFLSDLNGGSLCALEYDEENDVTALLKAFNVRIFQEENSLLERLVSYIKLGTRYLGVRQYFFVNLKCFLSENELALFYKETALEHVGLFLLENTVRDKINGEKIVIVDKDLCEIVV